MSSMKYIQLEPCGDIAVVKINRPEALNAMNIDREIVLLEAEDESALRRTHRRYFEDMRQLMEHTNAHAPK